MAAAAATAAVQLLQQQQHCSALGAAARRRIHSSPVLCNRPVKVINAMGGARSMDRPRRRPNFDRPSGERPVPPPPPPPEPLSGAVKYRISDSCSLVIWKGDIGLWFIDGKTDAIVAPANKRLNAGYGVDTTIHRFAGPRLKDFCQRLPDMAPQGVKCDVARAVITPGFNLQASRVIHAVGPVYEDKNRDEGEKCMIETYKAALNLATTEGIKYIAFPEMSVELYGYPPDVAAEISLPVVRNNWGGFAEIHFVLKLDKAYTAWCDEAKRLWR